MKLPPFALLNEEPPRIELEKKIEDKIVIQPILTKNLTMAYTATDPAPLELIAWWTAIFEYVGPNETDYLELRWSCRLFRDAIPPPRKFNCFPFFFPFLHLKLQLFNTNCMN